MKVVVEFDNNIPVSDNQGEAKSVCGWWICVSHGEWDSYSEQYYASDTKPTRTQLRKAVKDLPRLKDATAYGKKLIVADSQLSKLQSDANKARSNAKAFGHLWSDHQWEAYHFEMENLADAIEHHKCKIKNLG